MTKLQLGLLIGFFLGALVIFVTLGIIQIYLAERHERRNRVMNCAGHGLADDDQSTFYSTPITKSCLAPEAHSPTVMKMAEEEEERIIFLFILIE
jgi:hypothetical protein